MYSMQCLSSIPFNTQADVIASSGAIVTLHLARGGQEIHGRIRLLQCVYFSSLIATAQLCKFQCRARRHQIEGHCYGALYSSLGVLIFCISGMCYILWHVRDGMNRPFAK